MSDLTVPDEFDNWPFDAKNIVLAEANTAVDLRNAIGDRVGLDHVEEDSSDTAGQFTKDELATVLMALGGPEDTDA